LNVLKITNQEVLISFVTNTHTTQHTPRAREVWIWLVSKWYI